MLIVRLAEYKSYMPAGLFEPQEDPGEGREGREDEESASDMTDLEHSQHMSATMKVATVWGWVRNACVCLVIW